MGFFEDVKTRREQRRARKKVDKILRKNRNEFTNKLLEVYDDLKKEKREINKTLDLNFINEEKLSCKTVRYLEQKLYRNISMSNKIYRYVYQSYCCVQGEEEELAKYLKEVYGYKVKKLRRSSIIGCVEV